MPDNTYHVISNLHGLLSGPFASKSDAGEWAKKQSIPIGPASNPSKTGYYVAKNYGKKQ